MKKCILLLTLLLLLSNCDKKKTASVSTGKNRMSKEYYVAQARSECTSAVYANALQDHGITDSDYDTFAKNHPENMAAGIVEYKRDWADLEQFISANQIDCYNYYIGLYIKDGKIEFVKADYNDNGTCYSQPLFKAIKDKYSTATKTPKTLHFTKAIKNIYDQQGKLTDRLRSIIFKVEFSDGTLYHYDMSDDPSDET